MTMATKYDVSDERGSWDLYLALVAHELRAPAAAIRAVCEGVLARDHPAITARDVRRIHAAALTMGEVIDSMVDVARLMRLASPWTWDRVDLAEVCESAWSVAGPLAEQHGVQLHGPCGLDSPTTPRTISGDALALRRLLVNLLSNAIRATPAGGRVGVQVGSLEGRLALTVNDTGPGLNDRVLACVGQVHFSGVGAPGVGMGLWICRCVAAAHGGRIAIRSDRRTGTTVRVELRTDLRAPLPHDDPPPILVDRAADDP